MNLQHLRHLIAIAEHGSLREAARHLNLSQSAITKSLRALELELGAPLVTRGSRGSIISPVGRELLVHARLATAEIARMTERVRQLTDEGAGRFTIGSAATAGLELIAPLLLLFRARYPRAEFTVSGGLPSTLLPRLLDGSLDLVFGPAVDFAPTTVSSRPLYHSRNVLLVSQSHPLRAARSLEQLRECEWILTPDLARPDSSLGRALASAGVTLGRIVLYTDDPFLSCHLAARSEAVTVLRESFFKGGPLTSGLVEVPLENVVLEDQMLVYSRANSPLPFLAQRFVELLGTHLASNRVP